MGVHPSTYYRWRKPYLTYGVDALWPRERRLPRMPNHTPGFIEQRVLAFALAYPGFGPKRVAAELARERWGGIRILPNGVGGAVIRGVHVETGLLAAPQAGSDGGG